MRLATAQKILAALNGNSRSLATSPLTPSSNCDQRITLGTVPKDLDTEVPKTGTLKIEVHQGGVSTGIERSPDRHRLGRKAAIGEADDQGRTRPQDPQNFCQDLDGMLQVLNADTAQGRIAAVGL